jgi:hypothetical protein
MRTNTLATHAPTANGIEGADLTLPLKVVGPNIPSGITSRFPHLQGCTHLGLDEEHWGEVGPWVHISHHIVTSSQLTGL